MKLSLTHVCELTRLLRRSHAACGLKERIMRETKPTGHLDSATSVLFLNQKENRRSIENTGRDKSVTQRQEIR